MLGNMIELKKPTRMMLYIATCPFVSMEIATRHAAHTAQRPRSAPVDATKWPPERAVTIARIAATTATRAKRGRAVTRMETIAHSTATKLKWPAGAARLLANARPTQDESRKSRTPLIDARPI